MNLKKQSTNILLVLFILAGFLSGCGRQDDISFARTLMARLIDGTYRARHMIDWSRIKMLSYDVSRDYEAIKDKNARVGYERSFIYGISSSLKAKDVKMDKFYNWRLFKAHDPKATIVAANAHDNNTYFLFKISHESARQKLTELGIYFGEDINKGLETFQQGVTGNVGPTKS